MSWRTRSYDVLPALSVRGPELRSSLRSVTAASMLGAVWMVSVGGATMLNFGYLAGFAEFHWGVLSALMFGATLAQLPASYLIERTGLRKLQFIQTMVAGRLLWLVVACMPVLLLVLPDSPANRTRVAWTAMAVIFCSWLLAHLGIPAWVTWMADLIPARIRGRYFARRNLYSVAAQLLVIVTLGMLLDWALPVGPREQLRDQRIGAHEVPALAWMVGAIFAAAAVVGTVDVLLLRRVREMTRRVPPDRIGLLAILRDPFRDRSFVRFVGGLSTFTFGVALAIPFFGLNCQKHLGLSNLETMVILVAAGPVGSLVASKVWGRALDKWGRRPVLMLGMAGTVLSAWGWVVTPRSAPYVAAVAVFWGGIVWCGLLMARMNMELSFSQRSGRSTYTAAANVCLAVAGVAGGITGGWIAGLARGFHMEWGPFSFVNYHVMFFLSGLVRLLSLLWLIGMTDPGSKPVGHVARQLAAQLYHHAPSLLFMPVRLLGRPARLLRRIGGRPSGKNGPSGERRVRP